ncbi:MAG: chemotaxis protein CheA [Desulfuromonadaceae bacterium]|nr:chemotaxis protein CheA [Desulfuromonadaceae bacterium]
MDMSHYRELFVSEARGHLTAFNELILQLEGTGGDNAAINEIFRHAHSIKGMAATMGYDPIISLAHLLEDQLSRVRSGEWLFVPALADLLLESGDALSGMVSQVESGSEPIIEATGLLERLSLFSPDAKKCQTPEKPDAPCYLQNPSTEHNFRQSDSLKSIRIKTETLDRLVNITGELITNRYLLVDCAQRSGVADFDDPIHQLTALLRELRDEVFEARMLPFEIIAEKFPRLVRDLAHKQGKDVFFHLDGKDIELDRSILEEIAEPLVHILRNAVDHGMETPDERMAAGKEQSGDIRLRVARDKDHLEIVIEDDGRGMDPDRLKSKAVEKGVISAGEAEALTLQESFMLVCTPGFSTSETVSDVSGRGVGMDAVYTAVHSLGGELTIQSEIGVGSRFKMRLPITVSIINSLLVKSGKFDIAFPVNSVKRTLELKSADIIEEHGRQTILIDGSYIPVKSLNMLLGQAVQPDYGTALIPAVLCETGGSQIIFLVDRLCGQQEIFVRPLGIPLSRLRGINSATITGDGRVVFIADVAALA